MNLFFDGSGLKLITMNDQMIFSESILLIQTGRRFHEFYGIDDGSAVFDCGPSTFYRIALIKPERLDVLATAEAQKSAKGRRFLIWSNNVF